MDSPSSHPFQDLSNRDLGAAREKLRVAHALESLPKTSAAMGRGELSYAKVHALTRVANEEFLLMIGLRDTASHVEKLGRQYRRVQEVEQLSREARQQPRRSVSYHFDEENGSLVLEARLPAESGMQLLKALEVAIADLPLPPPPDSTAGRSEFDEGPSVFRGNVSSAAALNVSPPALRRALKSRDKGCSFPGCTHEKYVDGRHVHHWAEGGVRMERLDDGAWRFVRPARRTWSRR